MTKNSSYMIAFAAITGSLLLISPLIMINAFAHAHMTVEPTENTNAISLTIGHTNEPAFGARPGLHDGLHGLELSIEDEATALPLSGADLKVDKYYFKDLRSFQRASSVERADEIETNVTLAGVFGEPGHYLSRQIQQDGIYGYRIYGTIDYFGVAQIPIDTTTFCSMDGANTSKFNSPGWSGSYGCTDNIGDLAFPERSGGNFVSGSENSAEIQQAGMAGQTATATVPVAQQASTMSAFHILAFALPGAAVAGIFGMRAFRQRRGNFSL